MLEILVSGATGVGKSLYACAVLQAAKRNCVSAVCTDHELFTSHKNFQALFDEIRQRHVKGGYDLSLIVVNDGEPRLSVVYSGRVPYRLADTVFPGSVVRESRESRESREGRESG